MAFYEPTQNELAIARKMARDGASVEEIHAALKCPLTLKALRPCLIRHGIKIRIRRLAHDGFKTSLPRSN